MITQKELKEILDYDKTTGVFTWKQSRANNKIKIGSVAGNLQSNGYYHIKINYKAYLSHRLAWLYVFNEWPKNRIDHINGIKYDNRIENLRDIPQRENCQNYTIHRNGKLVGCSFNKNTKKWQSAIRVNGKLKHLGCYNTELEAHEAYNQAIRSK